MNLITFWVPWIVLVILCVGWLAIMYLQRSFRKRLHAMESANQELREQLRHLQIRSAHMRSERTQRDGFYTDLVDKLPNRISQLISGSDARDLSQLLVDTVADLFSPSEVVLFTLIRDRKQLVLTNAFGIPSSKIGNRYDAETGRPGCVVMKGITMKTSDFLGESMSMKRRIQANPCPECQMDVFTPLFQGSRVSGVLGMRRVADTFSSEEIGVFRMISEMGSNAIAFRSLLTRYQKMAHQDGLTGLVSKSHFKVMLGDHLMNASITCDPLALFMFDIDHFKAYNDRNGHLQGDELLKDLSSLIADHVRESDIAARYGGEEFVIALPGLDRKATIRVAEYLRRTIEKHPFPAREFQPMGMVSVSGGVAAYPQDGGTVDELIAIADERLYAAKDRGRNRIVATGMAFQK